MRRKPLRALAGFVIILGFSIGMVGASVAHGCHRSEVAGGRLAHQHQGVPDRTPAPRDCHCVGHPCCFVTVLSPAVGNVDVLLGPILVVPWLSFTIGVAPLQIPHRLPFATAPPIQLS
jgi:hypothetical protein